MSNISPFPATATFTPEQALDSARQLEPKDLIVIGYDSDDEFFVRSSRMDRKTALWLCELLKNYTMECT